MDIASLVGPTLPAGHPEVRAVMATTIAGSFTRGGTSRPLGNTTDTALLLGLREWSDCILVGAGTVRAEGYGFSPTPMAVLSSSLDLDTSGALFTGTVVVLCPERALHDAALAPRRRALATAGARLVSTGSGSAGEILGTLHRLGYARVTCEGGPGVYAALLSADLVDVLHVTVDPSLGAVDGSAGLALRGPSEPLRFALESAEIDHDSMLFCRYRRARR